MILKDEMAAFKIAKYAVEKTSLGYAQGIIVKSILVYKEALKHIQKLNDKWNRNKKVELVEIRNEYGDCSITLESPDGCFQGFMSL